MCEKHFYITRKETGQATALAIPLFKTRRKLELLYVGTEFTYKDNKYKVTKIESFFEYESFCNSQVQDHIDIFVEEI